MKILKFRIENYRNLTLVECDPVPEFMVICGGNGCGKSALLEALMTAKEAAGAYGNFQFDPRAVSADSTHTNISMTLAFSEEEQAFVKEKFGEVCPDVEEVVIRINAGGAGQAIQRSPATYHLLSFYSRKLGSPGFFDYITAHRQTQKADLRTWDSQFLSDDIAKQTLALSQQKFQYTKQYLAGLKMRDIQAAQSALRQGNTDIPDSLEDVRLFFDRFFAPMSFVDVFLDRSPFGFVIATPKGEIDIDDLSSGEKEILNIFIRFHQLKPRQAVILFDEADAHLHPDLERRYLEELRALAKDNQFLLTTHSPEMMIAAGSEALYTVLKQLPEGSGNQLVRVTETAQLHNVLSELMGTRGLVSFNQRIVFIEGEEASADRAIYESFYPPAQHNISFVPAGNSGTVRKTAEQVNTLLSTSVGFQQYYSIVDRDISRSVDDPVVGGRLFRLPVYHVENFLLDPQAILDVTQQMLGRECPYRSSADVERALKSLVLSDVHLKPFARALLDAKLATAAKAAYDAVYRGNSAISSSPTVPDFASAESEACTVLTKAVEENRWSVECKGRDILKAFCGIHGIKYDHFRNSLIARLKTPPPGLASIMSEILGVPTSTSRSA
jgi:predicted ATPase